MASGIVRERLLGSCVPAAAPKSFASPPFPCQTGARRRMVRCGAAAGPIHAAPWSACRPDHDVPAHC